MATLSEHLLSLKSKYSSDDLDWVKYVKDHYTYLLKNASTYVIDPSHHYWEYYRLEDYLQTLLVDKSLAWLVLLLNQLGDNSDFKDKKTIIVPSGENVMSLYSSYLQYKSHIKSCRS